MSSEKGGEASIQMTPSKSSQSREEFRVFEEHLANNGLKHSRQREVILQILPRDRRPHDGGRSLSSHPS